MTTGEDEKRILRARYRERYGYESTYLTQEAAARLIVAWIEKKGYGRVWKQDVRCLLAENRRISRASNVGKYGRIPFVRSRNGKALYKFEDIRHLIENHIKPICVELEKQRIDLAKRAGMIHAA